MLKILYPIFGDRVFQTRHEGGGSKMPVITIEAGKMSKEQKKGLIEGFTKVASETLNIAAQAFSVILKENDADNVGSGGKMLSQILAERQE